MPLHDHFRPPVNDTHSWDGMFGGWPCMIFRQLVAVLPDGFRSGPRVQLGRYVDIDSEPPRDSVARPDQSYRIGLTGSVLDPTLTIDADLTAEAEYEVRIYDTDFGRNLVATIELVCPSHKDTASSRAMFAAKVVALLQQGVCVTLVDVVSTRPANLYAEVLTFLDRTDPQLSPTPPPMYSVTLRARKPPKGRGLLDAWFYPMAIGQPLPTLPIWLTPELYVMSPLEISYRDTCDVLGIE